MKLFLKILAAILVSLCAALTFFGIFFQVKYYWQFPLTDDGHNAADVIAFYTYMGVIILSLASAFTALPMLLVKRWRSVRYAFSICAVAALVFFAYQPLLEFVFRKGVEDYPGYLPKSGDIIFHTSKSNQSLAIQKATGSPLSHMGIIYIDWEGPFVFEAIGPPTLTPLQKWIERGDGKKYSVKRLKNADAILTPAALKKMQEVGRELRDRPYDSCFEWSDDAIYCSELVWKIYSGALGLEIGDLQVLSDFDLSSPEVQAQIAQKDCPLDPDEVVISPRAMFESELLEAVFPR